jgi:hypothetical protein
VVRGAVLKSPIAKAELIASPVDLAVRLPNSAQPRI